MKKLNVGIIGCGVIGSAIAEACVRDLKDKIELVALFDIDGEKANETSRLSGHDIKKDSMEAVFNKADLVIESAASSVSQDVVKKAVEKSKDVMIMSVGGLVESEDLLEEARKKNAKVYFPSGAICGIDGLKAAGISGIKSVTLTTKKPPKGLEGAPYLKSKGIDLNSVKGEKVLFEGSAKEAIKGFPKNVNVSSILSLAGIGAKETVVKIVVSPDYTKNTHEVEITGDFGRITTKTENVPSRRNPRTSELAILSAIATLKGIVDSVRMGT
ncbi:MAG: aspartate dehydrogenase [Candidatus Omnitrophota bacterium]